MSDREIEILSFLKTTDWAKAARNKLPGDASTRSYELLTLGDKTAYLMNAPLSEESPPCPPEASDEERLKLGWNASSRLAACRVDAFVGIDLFLRDCGFYAPEIYAFDTENGFAILEDLKAPVFARQIEEGANEIELYKTAAQTLAALHKEPVPEHFLTNYEKDDAPSWPLLDFDRLALETNANLFAEWFGLHDQAFKPDDAALADLAGIISAMIDAALSYPGALTLRDYHAENLIWRSDQEGIKQVGLLDFQDAVYGWPEWDFAMLLQDARREVSEEAREAAITAYLDEMESDRDTFDLHLALLGAINAMRISGLFVRLIERDKKPKYKAFLPRQIKLLAENLKHPINQELTHWMRAHSPVIKEAMRR